FLEGTLSANPMDSIGQRGLEELLERMENEEFDMIAVGRALLQDPEWTVKVQQNRLDELADFDRAAIAKLY
ncbi:MAG: 12-oxophytodienoate reductase, partial [Ketobacter sp.]